ncbi:MAG TPA: chorismate-binding protein [Ramlibacter sp.]|nr:chorismate-binding protein [Ramlibacter sp.]
MSAAPLQAFIDFPASGREAGRWRARFAGPVEELVASHPGEVEAVLRRAQAHAEAGRWCLGAVAYEAASAFDPALVTHPPLAGWPLARFAVFDQALPWPEDGEGTGSSDCTPWRFSMEPDTYARRVAQAQQAMAAGECYQVNLTGTLEAEFSGELAPWMARLRAAQPDGYLLWLDWGDRQVLSASPELFFDWQPGLAGGQLLCRPMKGTAPRHADPVLDARARQQLADCTKERAENVMIVDLLRNDLGRIAQPGTVRVESLFQLEALPTVWQMTSTIAATTQPGVGLAEVFRALFPCGSVTGAPKASAMRWIRELEDGPRGVYCGAAGVLRPGGAATFNVPIRTVAAQCTAGEAGRAWSVRYGVGSGLTAYANAQAEWQELRAKSRVLERSTRPFELLETLRLEHGRHGLLQEHLDRMARSAAWFGFACDRPALERLLLDLASRQPEGAWRVRLSLARSGRTDLQVERLAPTDEPVHVVLAEQALDTQGADQEFVAHKTTRRGHYDSRLSKQAGVFDTLLVNARGELTEFTRGNLALRIDGQWLTPAARCGLLPGTLRAALLAQGRLTEAVLLPADLRRAQDVVFFNSLRGWLRAQLPTEGASGFPPPPASRRAR